MGIAKIDEQLRYNLSKKVTFLPNLIRGSGMAPFIKNTVTILLICLFVIPTAHVDVSASENHEVLTIPAKLFANKLRKHDPIFFSSLESFLEKKTGNYLC